MGCPHNSGKYKLFQLRAWWLVGAGVAVNDDTSNLYSRSCMNYRALDMDGGPLFAVGDRGGHGPI